MKPPWQFTKVEPAIGLLVTPTTTDREVKLKNGKAQDCENCWVDVRLIRAKEGFSKGKGFQSASDN